MKHFSVFISAAISILLILSSCASYSKEVKKALTRSFEQDFREYYFRGTPIGNFGVGTIYAYDSVKNKKPNPNSLQSEWLKVHPDDWFIETISDVEKNAFYNKIIKTGTLGSFSVDEKISKKLSLNVILPNIKSILNLGASVDFDKGITVILTADEAIIREVNWNEFLTAINDGKIKPYVRNELLSNNIVMGCKDIILIGYRVQITIDQTIQPKLDAKLKELCIASNVVGSDLGLKLKISLTSNGKYEIAATKPVVAAVIYLKPPAIRDKSGLIPNIDKWTPVFIKDALLDPIELLLK